MKQSPSRHIYLDYNATSPMLPGVLKCLQEGFSAIVGNPSSPHQGGRSARDLLEQSRKNIAETLGVTPQEILFTSGGSEGNNTLLRQFQYKPTPFHIITSSIEHPSIHSTVQYLAGKGLGNYSTVAVSCSGSVAPESLKDLVRENTVLLSVMLANNETGTIQPCRELAEFSRNHHFLFHADCVQGAGKMTLNLKDSGMDYATFSAHKIGGPPGIGLLYVRNGVSLEPLITGGKQERSRRAGTENSVMAAGFAEALSWHVEHQPELDTKWREFKRQMIDAFQKIDGFFMNGNVEQCLSNTLNFGFEGLSAESLLIRLDLDGISVSTGSACSSGALEASHVLLAMGLSRKQAKSCLRVSMGWNTTSEDITVFIERLLFHARKLYEKRGTFQKL
ncbi:MAG: cysteine desulfurase [SAR324 cluster bacterium]|nr:cysteine desulfurase [SAR324 cluster bacterium]